MLMYFNTCLIRSEQDIMRETNRELYKFIRTEFKQNPYDGMHYFYATINSKPSIFNRIKNWFKIFKFDMNFTQKSIEDYLSRSRDHYDLEQRERNVMNGKVRFA